MKVAKPINMGRQRRQLQAQEGKVAPKQDAMPDPEPGSRAAKIQEKQNRRAKREGRK